MAPVNTNFASLNLAQAVLLVGYEWMKQSGARHARAGDDLRGAAAARAAHARLAAGRPRRSCSAFFEHIERELERNGFFSPPEKRPSMVQNMRTMFTRMGATEQEIRTLRGIVKALVQPQARRRELRLSYASISIERCALARQVGLAEPDVIQERRNQALKRRGLQMIGQARAEQCVTLGLLTAAVIAAPMAVQRAGQGAERPRRRRS